ncbi:hypothetical protein JM93_00644 [Roseibium hamelinense]|uniref:Uncharacterized protein n=1 Tax=Roseibium hamelinense TaxID=150831 RepID=A0A562TJT8_9HYPH|nr:hypothetical protein [Roseibium hamelinense]MTI45727.1 hypothetical protein [Roseibium hamelinense]TWI93090.1 hypothetical protein JM93_00644 [Roseibium hamelinense]
MQYYPADANPSLEIQFVKGHIAATMTLILGLVEQDILDRDRLDRFFEGFLNELPHSTDTMGLRIVLDEWRKGLREGADDSALKAKLFEVIQGGRVS